MGQITDSSENKLAMETGVPTIVNNITPEDSSIITQLKSIESKLSVVEKKLSDKWMLPIIIAIITAILAFGNYFTQRLFANSDLFTNQVSKSNAEVKSQNTSAFYKQCFAKIDTISQAFEAYCTIGRSAFEDSIITAKSIQLTNLIDIQFPLDPTVKKYLQDYIGYVNNQLIEMENEALSTVTPAVIYTISKHKYDSTVAEINAAFLDPSR